MYQYTDFDRQFVHARAAQFRDQLDRHFAGQLDGDDFKALRLQNGWYIQRHAPMLRVAVPYGAISSRQIRALAEIARVHDRGYTHFTTRQNVQFNWIPLTQAADVMDKLAAADMHGIQTSGNCIRNTTTDGLAGVAADEIVDPRPYCELLRQWSTLHPEFAFLPRKFKIAVSGAVEDRAAIGWHDVGLQLKKNEAGEIGFRVQVGGGMGRTPIIGSVISEFVPWQQILVYLEAIIRVYNRYGRRDNAYKARIKILVKAEGQKYFDAVNAEFANILSRDLDGAAHLITQAEFDRVAACFTRPAEVVPLPEVGLPADLPLAYQRWIQRNVHAHQVPGWRAVTLSVKRAGQAPGDVTDVQMDQAADLADRYSFGELRVTHDQNLLLPWIKASDLPEVYAAAKAAGYATPNIGLVTDMIACPGGDFCDLANARSIPVAAELTERFADLDEVFDLGEIDLHISGCINSCGHHHSGHIGILGVDKDGSEWYQVTLGGSDGSAHAPTAVPGKVIGPSFAASEITDAVEAILETYRSERAAGEKFIDTLHRLGLEPFKVAANAQRIATARDHTAAA
ncbi:nitrite/sulfite reductase [Sphaerotilus montanus]|uniref:Sulfite reductase (NADPH) hemoprotein beta-component n=1 Tax=Sphaerotilus montanus TaxID=522889 RepID=A0A7Y9U3R1_9BURK|nr:nitrite/sulfite reductase [Sphaerotilus montanus]NYG31153.1 sulfite reductase (NADPH) hemoprotein beta-component [Sphaerotilus montanus]NZD55139.1 nitrite/sulfite reductase [Sphaerotilus montanus]